MEEEKVNFLKLAFSPFDDNEETRYIKQYAKQLGQLDDFKYLKLFFVQYNDIKTYKQKMKLEKLPENIKWKIVSLGAMTLPYNGIYSTFSKKIMIFVDNIIKYSQYKCIVINPSKLKIYGIKYPDSLKCICCNILKTMYHEKKHYLQNIIFDNSFESIMWQIEKNLKTSSYGAIKYKFKHDKWYFEIDANNYGVNKTIEYYKNHPDDKNVDFNYLEKNKVVYEYDQLTYNFDVFFTVYNEYNKNLPHFFDLKNKLINISFNNQRPLWQQILYNEKNQLKNIDDILNHPSINEIDQKFINRVLTSKYLNKNIDYNNLDIQSLNRIKIEFNNILKETIEIINKISLEQDKLIIYRTKNDLKRLKEDIKYYNDTIALIETKILNQNNQLNHKHNK